MPQDHPDGTVPMQITGADKKLPTDWQDQYRGVYLQPDWAAKEDIDKTLEATEADQARGNEVHFAYTPNGKTLYITYFCAYCKAHDAADSDLNQMCWGLLANITDAKYYARQGGNGGFMITFPTPIVIPAGKLLHGHVYNAANHNCDIGVSAGGYEL